MDHGQIVRLPLLFSVLLSEKLPISTKGDSGIELVDVLTSLPNPQNRGGQNANQIVKVGSSALHTVKSCIPMHPLTRRG